MDKAPQYLQHFCSRLHLDVYSTHEPIYRFAEDSAHLICATVILPGGIDDSMRQQQGMRFWRTEKAARRDAAFQAYLRLYSEGLVNKHLLPIPQTETGPSAHPPKLPPRVNIPAVYDVWSDEKLARRHIFTPRGTVKIALSRRGQSELRLSCVLAKPLVKAIPPCEIYWSNDDTWRATFRHESLCHGTPGFVVEQVEHSTRILLNGASRQPVLQDDQRPVVLLTPTMRPSILSAWIEDNCGSMPATAAFDLNLPCGLVRHAQTHHQPRIIVDWLSSHSIQTAPVPRRRNFLSPPLQAATRLQPNMLPNEQWLVREADRETVPTEGALVDKLHMDNMCWSMILPSIFHHLETTMLAQRLCQTLLQPLDFDTTSSIIEALTAPSSGNPVNYQRLEFIGDSVLKFITSVQLFLQYSRWHEGYLTLVRKNWTCNQNMAQAAIEHKLGMYIITDPFAARRWRPPCVDDAVLEAKPSERLVSSKMLADVVEALIGAAFQEKNLSGAARCVHTFLPAIDPCLFDEERLRACGQEPESGDTSGSPTLSGLQDLIAYRFCRSALLWRAVTHASCLSFGFGASYQRLEYLGDAVLDFLVAEQLSQHRSALSHVRMHLIKSTLVNAHMLAFWCIDLAMEQIEPTVVPQDGLDSQATYTIASKSRRIALCHFLRFDNLDMSRIRTLCESRHQEMVFEIRHALLTGSAHPWSQLIYIGAPKFVSDMIESILGAIYIDSRGCLEPCRQFLDTIGLAPYLNRLIAQDVEIRHPKTLLSYRRREKVTYSVTKTNGPDKTFRCCVKIGTEQFPTIEDGVSREDATTRAAVAALKIIEQSI